MFVLILMSHGTRGNVIFDSNNQPVDLIDLQGLLKPMNFSAMEGKPKVIIVQACSGGELFSILLAFFGGFQARLNTKNVQLEVKLVHAEKLCCR